MSYDAFISYSHGADAHVAEALESGLQRFSKPWYRRRALDVFRDTSALSANPGLWTSIADAMAASGWLVVCCSPEAAASPWVAREIENWCATKPAGRIMLALTAGDLVWNDTLGRFDPETSTAASPALAAAFAEEPLYVDMRWARSDGQLTIADPRFQGQIADLAAPIHGVDKDALIGEDVRQHRRTVRVAAFAAIALGVLAIATAAGAVIAVKQANNAKHNAEAKVRLQTSLDQAHKDLDHINAEVTQQTAALADAKSSLSTAQHDTTTAQHDAAGSRLAAGLAAAKAEDAHQAELTSDSARARADAASRQALTARDEAEARATDADQQATTAQGRADQAQQLQDQADLEAAAAAIDAQKSKLEATAAQHDRDAAKAAEAQAQADATATQLASDSSQLVPGQLDLALLLAHEASLLQPAPAKGAATPSATNTTARSAASVEGYDALVSSIQAAGPLQGYLQFPHGIGPQQLGKVAVSPDGTYVAAAEDTTNIEFGDAPAHVFIWHASDPTSVRAVELPGTFGCVTDLEWTAADTLITIDSPGAGGCIEPAPAYVDPSGAEFIDTHYSEWTGTGRRISTELDTDFPSYAQSGTSPITMSPDHRHIVATFDSGTPFQNGSPELFLELRDTVTGSVDVTVGAPGSSFGVPTFSPDGRYATGIDYGIHQGTPAVWDFGPDASPNACLHPNLVGTECFREAVPSDAANVFTGLKLSPNDASFAAETLDGEHVQVFSSVDGHLLQTYTSTQLFGDFAISKSAVSVTRVDGARIIPRANLALPGVVVPTPMNPLCTSTSFASGGALVLLDDFCDTNHISTVAADPTTGAVRANMHGDVVFSGAGSPFVVTQTLDLTNGHYGMELWGFPTDPAQAGAMIDSRSNGKPVVAPDGSAVAAFHATFPGEPEGEVALWTLSADGQAHPQTLGGSLHVGDAVFDNSHHLVGVGAMPAGIVWNTKRAPYTLLYSDAAPGACVGGIEPGDNLLRSAISPDNLVRAKSTDAQTIQLITLSDGTTRTLPPLGLVGNQRIDYMAFTKDGQRLLVNIETPNPHPAADDPRCRNGVPAGSVVVDLASGRVRPETETALRSSDDGTRILFASRTAPTLLVRDATTLAPVGRPFATGTIGHDPTPGSIGGIYTIDAHGTRVAGTNATGAAVVWTFDGTDFTPASALLPPGGVQPTANVSLTGIAFSPDGRHLAVKTVDQRLLVWDLTSSAAPQVKQLPNDAAARIAYSPAGDLIAVDGVYVFDAATLHSIGSQFRPVEWDDTTFDRGTIGLQFVETDGALYIESERTFDTAAARWRIDVPYLQTATCTAAGRNLTHAEFALYGIPGTYGATPCAGRPPETGS